MSFLQGNIFKKTTAVFFMALVAVVLAGKALHTHNSFLTAKAQTNAHSTVETRFFCSICEFQLTKDSDAETATIQIKTPFIFLHHAYYYTTSNPVFADKDFSVRGPPAASLAL